MIYLAFISAPFFVLCTTSSAGYPCTFVRPRDNCLSINDEDLKDSSISDRSKVSSSRNRKLLTDFFIIRNALPEAFFAWYSQRSIASDEDLFRYSSGVCGSFTLNSPCAG